MALSYTSDELIESVLNLYTLPGTNPEGGTDADILRHLSEAMKSRLIPDIIRLREDFLVVTTRHTLSSNKLRIPKRAIGNRIRDIVYWDGSSVRKQLNFIDRSRLTDYTTGESAGVPDGVFLEGNFIRFVPDTTYTCQVEVSFYFRPGDLVVESSAAQITSVNTSTKTITCSGGYPTTPTNWTGTMTFDIHSKESGAEIKVWSESGTISSNDITFTNAIDGSTYGTELVEVGDWVCLENEAVIPAVPREVHPILVELAALQLAKSVETDTEALAVRFAEAKNYRESLKNLLYDRVEPKPLYIRGQGGLLRMGWR